MVRLILYFWDWLDEVSLDFRRKLILTLVCVSFPTALEHISMKIVTETAAAKQQQSYCPINQLLLELLPLNFKITVRAIMLR